MMNDRVALIIGNDNYSNVSKLRGCENDCNAIKKLLRKNDDGSHNFTLDKHINVTNQSMKRLLAEHLNKEYAHLVFYFSGHGYIDNEGGYICGVDTSRDDYGVSMEWLSILINESDIREVTVILDCCHAGQMFNIESGKGNFATLRQGVSFLAATKKEDLAEEFLGRGIFTSIIEEGLKGAAKDIFGYVSIAGLYGCADKMLSPIQQRPVYKSFIDRITPIRKCTPIIGRDLVEELNTIFPKENHRIRINRDILDRKKTEFDIDFETFMKLQSFENASMLEGDTSKSLLETALYSRGFCQLNTYGRYIWRLVKKREIY
ncbi:MAG: caspase family protein [Flavobacteriales bacterium]|jgi:hypothetical protein|nr:caspase family protein [Flavobacteriales bacterium]